MGHLVPESRNKQRLVMLMTLDEAMTGVNMVFAHDTEESLITAAALVNTAGPGHEGLPDVAALDGFLRRYDWTGRHDHTEAELKGVRDLRPRLRRIWDEDEDGVVEIVNRLLRESKALPQLVRHDHEPYHLHATSAEAPLAVRMAVEAAMAFVDVVRTGELGRLRTCEYPGCGSVVVDLSKNRSRRFCDAGCSNRAAVNAYRARRAAAQA
jgi:predicted RNA-binding Zn ribbon-like protein